jgi:hypothetical protein
VPAAASGQHEHWHGDSRIAPSPQHRQAVETRQPEVEDDGVVRLSLAEEVGAFSVHGAVNRVAGLAKRACQLMRQQRLVLHDQHTQQFLRRADTWVGPDIDMRQRARPCILVAGADARVRPCNKVSSNQPERLLNVLFTARSTARG